MKNIIIAVVAVLVVFAGILYFINTRNSATNPASPNVTQKVQSPAQTTPSAPAVQAPVSTPAPSPTPQPKVSTPTYQAPVQRTNPGGSYSY